MDGDTGRILDDDELINLNETRQILGGVSVSTCYEDSELMRLKINMTAGERAKRIRFVRREILALRAERVARAEANADNVVAGVEARVERRRIQQRERHVRLAKAAEPKPAFNLAKPRKRKLRPRPRVKAEGLPR